MMQQSNLVILIVLSVLLVASGYYWEPTRTRFPLAPLVWIVLFICWVIFLLRVLHIGGI